MVTAFVVDFVCRRGSCDFLRLFGLSSVGGDWAWASALDADVSSMRLS